MRMPLVRSVVYLFAVSLFAAYALLWTIVTGLVTR